MTAKVQIEKCNGKDYPIISDITAKSNVLHFRIDIQYQNSATFVNEVVNRAVNANWKLCKSAIDSKFNEFITDFIGQEVISKFSHVALQDFIELKESC